MSTADLPEVLPAPPGRPPTLPPEDIALVLPVRRTSVAQHLLRFVLAVGGWAWRWLVGAVMCFNFFVLSWFTSIAVVGWTNRVVQQLVLRCWWWRSELRRRMTFAEFCDSLGVDAPSPRPRWFVQDHLRVHAHQPLRGGGRPDFVTVAGRTLWWPWYSLWLNFKLGVKAILGTHGPVVHFLDWQARTFAPLHEHVGADAVARGEQHRAPRACDRVRERRAPRACSDDGDAIEGHA